MNYDGKRGDRLPSAKAEPHSPASAVSNPGTYLRATVSGILTCMSDLHVGAGETLPWKERKEHLSRERKAPEWDTDPEYHAVCWSEDRPYLPASTLRGALRAQLADDTRWRDCLFGRTDRAGAVRMENAFLAEGDQEREELPPYFDQQRKTAAHHGIELDPLTGTVRNGRLFSHEVVPAGSRFRLKMTLERCNDETLQALLALLQHWDGTLCSALGAKRGKGWGCVRWDSETVEVRVLTESQVLGWLDAPLEQPLGLGEWPGSADPAPLQKRQRPDPVQYALIFDGPALVGEPGYRKAKTHSPDQEYSRCARDGSMMIPGRSLVGMLRGRARRILASIAHLHYGAAPDHAVDMAERLIGEVFGDTGQRGALWVGDAVADADAEAKVQYFNAIDRFTGGTADGLLYQANAGVDVAYRGSLLLEAERLQNNIRGEHPNWWKGLLLYLARDALDGELAVGWGKAKGYGALRQVRLEWNGDGADTWDVAWRLLLGNFSEDCLQRWTAELHAAVKEQVNALPASRSDYEGEKSQ